MTFKEASRIVRKVGTANAEGDAYRATYAQALTDLHGGDPELYYAHLRSFQTDRAVRDEGLRLGLDRSAAWDVLMDAQEGDEFIEVRRAR